MITPISCAPVAQPLSNDGLALVVTAGNETSIRLGCVEDVAASLKVTVHELH